MDSNKKPGITQSPFLVTWLVSTICSAIAKALMTSKMNHKWHSKLCSKECKVCSCPEEGVGPAETFCWVLFCNHANVLNQKFLKFTSVVHLWLNLGINTITTDQDKGLHETLSGGYASVHGPLDVQPISKFTIYESPNISRDYIAIQTIGRQIGIFWWCAWCFSNFWQFYWMRQVVARLSWTIWNKNISKTLVFGTVPTFLNHESRGIIRRTNNQIAHFSKCWRRVVVWRMWGKRQRKVVKCKDALIEMPCTNNNIQDRKVWVVRRISLNIVLSYLP